MKAAVSIFRLLSQLVCAIWPFLAFFSVFTLDAPFKGPADEFERYAFIALFLAYPWGHFVAEKRKQTEKWERASTCLLFMCPYLHLGAVGALVSLIGGA